MSCSEVFVGYGLWHVTNQTVLWAGHWLRPEWQRTLHQSQSSTIHLFYEQSDTKQSKQTDTDNQKKISIDSKNSKLKVQLISDLLTIPLPSSVERVAEFICISPSTLYSLMCVCFKMWRNLSSGNSSLTLTLFIKGCQTSDWHSNLRLSLLRSFPSWSVSLQRRVWIDVRAPLRSWSCKYKNTCCQRAAALPHHSAVYDVALILCV